jgi:rod shape-determining protein MreC
MFLKRLFVFIGVTLFVAIIFSVITMSSKNVLPVSSVERLALSIISPFFRATDSTIEFTRDIWSRYFLAAQAVSENAALRVRLAQTTEFINRCKELELENTRLKKLVDFTDSVQDTYIAARIIARDPSSWFRTVIIDKGMEDGLEKGSPVLVSEGVVGQLIEVSGNFARVLLIIDRNSSVDALVRNTRVRGIIKGNNEKQCFFVYTLRKDEVKDGEIIITSGLDQVFPKGLIIGKVLKVTKTQSQLFQDITVETSVDFEKLEEVLVLKKALRSSDF